ncbi:hypothetical protein D3C73_1519870 [compost metagenome]
MRDLTLVETCALRPGTRLTFTPPCAKLACNACAISRYGGWLLTSSLKLTSFRPALARISLALVGLKL